jgi:hypothetical protein
MNGDKISALERIRSFLKEKREIAKQKKEQELINQKQETINYLNKPMTDAEIISINCDIIANSAGWLGGNWTEKDIKSRFLRVNKNLFNDDEYQYYYDQIINLEQKIKR